MFLPACVSLWNILDESYFYWRWFGGLQDICESYHYGTINLFIFLSRSFIILIFYHSFLSSTFSFSFDLFVGLRWRGGGWGWWGVFGHVGSGLYLRCRCLLSGGVLVGKSPTLFQVRVSLFGSSIHDYTSSNWITPPRHKEL